jgi:type I restriction enzyme S subunit
MGSDWVPVRLGDLISVKHGYAFKGEFFSEGSTPYRLTTPGNFAIGGGFQIGKPKYYNGPIPEDYILTPGDLIVTMTDLSKTADTLGFAALVPNTLGTTWLHNQRIGLVLPKPKVPALPRFLHYLMRTTEYRHWVVSSASGSTVKHTSPGRICDYTFLLPPVSVQQQIAEILDSLDTKIALLRETIASLEAIAQALFKSWFVDFEPVRAKAEGRDPEGVPPEVAELFPSEFEYSELGAIPKGWRIRKWGDIVTLEYGKALRGYRESEGAIPVYGTNGPIGFHDVPQCIHPGIVVGRKGAYRGIHFCPEPFCVIDTAFYMEAREDLSWRWAYYEALRFDLNAMDSGSAIPSTDRNLFYRIPLCTPPLALQRAFEDLLSSCWEKQGANNLEVNTLANLRDCLLPRLMSGKLPIPEVAI